MTTDITVVKKDTPVDQVLQILVDKNITGRPVVDQDMVLVGMITEKDILRLIYNTQEYPGNAGDYMSTQIVRFNENDDLIAVCECLVKGRFRRVPIVSGGKLVGVISRRDIIKYILEPIG
jgi:CBS domain-containing protein